MRQAAAGICLLKCFCLCFCCTFRAKPEPRIPCEQRHRGVTGSSILFLTEHSQAAARPRRNTHKVNGRKLRNNVLLLKHLRPNMHFVQLLESINSNEHLGLYSEFIGLLTVFCFFFNVRRLFVFLNFTY